MPTPFLDMPLLAAGQSQKHVTVNEALLALDAMVHLVVAGPPTASPPAQPAENSRHLVAAGAAGAFAGREGDIALRRDGAWIFQNAADGWTARSPDGKGYTRRAGAWSADADQPASYAQLGINTTAAANRRLSVSSSSTLLQHEGQDHRLVINRAAEQDTASVVFQTAAAGAAEIGLCGNGQLSVKTSPAAGQWRTSVAVTPGGDFGLGTASPNFNSGQGRVVHVHADASAAAWSLTHYTVGALSGPADGMIVGNLGGAAYVWNYASNDLVLGVGGAAVLVVKPGGAVGIGSTTPTARLDVSGPIRTRPTTLAALPAAASAGAGAIAFVSDASGGACLALSTGSAWLRLATAGSL